MPRLVQETTDAWRRSESAFKCSCVLKSTEQHLAVELLPLQLYQQHRCSYATSDQQHCRVTLLVEHLCQEAPR